LQVIDIAAFDPTQLCLKIEDRDVRYACPAERCGEPPSPGPTSRIRVEDDPDTHGTNGRQFLSKLIEDDHVGDCPFTRAEANRWNVPIVTPPDARLTVDDVEGTIVVRLNQEQSQGLVPAVRVCPTTRRCPRIFGLQPVDELDPIDAEHCRVTQGGSIAPHVRLDAELLETLDGEPALRRERFEIRRPYLLTKTNAEQSGQIDVPAPGATSPANPDGLREVPVSRWTLVAVGMSLGARAAETPLLPAESSSSLNDCPMNTLDVRDTFTIIAVTVLMLERT
jgi:hypothetical protein